MSSSSKWTVGIEGGGLRRKHVDVEGDVVDAVDARAKALKQNPGYTITLDVTAPSAGTTDGIGSGK